MLTHSLTACFFPCYCCCSCDTFSCAPHLSTFLGQKSCFLSFCQDKQGSFLNFLNVVFLNVYFVYYFSRIRQFGTLEKIFDFFSSYQHVDGKGKKGSIYTMIHSNTVRGILQYCISVIGKGTTVRTVLLARTIRPLCAQYKVSYYSMMF